MAQLDKKKIYHVSRIIPHLNPKNTKELNLMIESLKKPITIQCDSSEEIYSYLNSYIMKEEKKAEKQFIDEKEAQICTDMGDFLCVDPNK